MKVLVVSPSLFTSFYDKHFCRALVQIGVSVTLVGRPLRPHEQFLVGPFAFRDLFYRGTGQREASWQNSRLDRIRKSLEHVTGLRALARLAAEQNADIVHFQWLMLPFLDRIALQRMRRRYGLVLTVHNAEFSAHDSSAAVGRLGTLLQSLDQKRAVLSFDRYVVHSSKTFDSLIALGVTSNRIVHLPHPPLDLDVSSVPQSVSADDGRRDILFFGKIKHYKGVDILIEAGIALAATRRDFRITIAGRPHQTLDAMRARIAVAGVEDAFRFDLNYLSDARLAEYLQAAGIVVFPYREIDGSGAMSHAIRFEKPIVASRVGGFAESPFKDHVELVPPGDANALAATLAHLLDNPSRLEQLEQQTRVLKGLLPTWTDFARACRTAYGEIAPRPEGH